MRKDFNVMYWTPDESPWSNVANVRYLEGRHDGIFCRLGRHQELPNLDFLRDLPNLKYVEIVGHVVDDTAAFQIPELHELFLVTRCRKTIPDLSMHRGLLRLGLEDRPGKEQMRALPQLRQLRIWRWKGPDLTFLPDNSELELLTIEATRIIASAEGIETCRQLQVTELTEMRVADLKPFASLHCLRRLGLVGDRRIPDGAVLDLADLANLSNLEELALTFAGRVGSIAALLELPALRDVRLRGTQIVDGDLSPLDELRRYSTVVAPDE